MFCYKHIFIERQILHNYKMNLQKMEKKIICKIRLTEIQCIRLWVCNHYFTNLT